MGPCMPVFPTPPELQNVGHSLMSNEIPPVVGHIVWINVLNTRDFHFRDQ